MRSLKVAGQLAVVLLAVVLTVANSAAPEVRTEVHTKKVQGDHAIVLDTFTYEDKGFEARIAAGAHKALTLEEVSPRDPKGVVLELKAGDKRFVSAPAPIELLPRERSPRGSYRLTLEEEDGTKTVVEFELGPR